MVTFANEVDEDAKYYYVGAVESDLLVIEKSTGNVMVVDMAATEHVLWHCAESGEQFLDALSICCTFLTNRLFDSSLDEPSLINAAVKKCTVASGGNSFMDFYKMILGSEE